MNNSKLSVYTDSSKYKKKRFLNDLDPMGNKENERNFNKKVDDPKNLEPSNLHKRFSAKGKSNV